MAGEGPPTTYYQNQATPQTGGTYGTDPIDLTKDGLVLFYLDPPHEGDRELIMVSEFDVNVMNTTPAPVTVRALIGVGSPSEDNNPMNPWTSLTHPYSVAVIPPRAMVPLHVGRLDVINPKLLPTPIPWQMNKDSHGNYPRLAMQVFGPTSGVKLYNASSYLYLLG